MKKAQRIQKRQEHAEAYKEGFDDGFRLGVQTAMAMNQRHEKPPDDQRTAKEA